MTTSPQGQSTASFNHLLTPTLARCKSGVRILPEEELYAEYGKNYWLDHLPSLSPEARRHCLQKYKYKASELTKAGLRADGSRQSSAPSIVSFLRATPSASQLHSLFLHEDTISNHPTVRLHFAQPSSPRLAYDPSLSLQEGSAEGRAGTNCPRPPYLTGQPEGRAGLIRTRFSS